MIDDFTPHQRAIGLLLAAFPVPAWEEPTLRLYAEKITEFPGPIVQRTVMEWIETQPERPSIAELRVACSNMRNRWRRDQRRLRDAAAVEAPPLLEERVDVGELLRTTIRKIGGGS